MGCDYELLIQVLYGSTWVTIVAFGTKTRCGGFPLCTAVFRVKEYHGVDGNHGRHQKNNKIDDGRIKIMKFHVSNETPKSGLGENRSAKRKRIAGSTEVEITGTSVDPKIKEKNSHEEVLKIDDGASQKPVCIGCNTVDEEDIKFMNRRFVYYSLLDFPRYVSTVESLEYQDGKLFYTHILRPVVTWCQMALTAGPCSNLSDIWMSHEQKEIHETTEKIRKAQSALCAAHTRFMSQFKSKFGLTGPLFDKIVQWTTPCGSDVRVALRDDEEQTELFLQGKQHRNPCRQM